jgi:hypothetical protein
VLQVDCYAARIRIERFFLVATLFKQTEPGRRWGRGSRTKNGCKSPILCALQSKTEAKIYPKGYKVVNQLVAEPGKGTGE